MEQLMLALARHQVRQETWGSKPVHWPTHKDHGSDIDKVPNRKQWADCLISTINKVMWIYPTRKLISSWTWLDLLDWVGELGRQVEFMMTSTWLASNTTLEYLWGHWKHMQLFPWSAITVPPTIPSYYAKNEHPCIENMWRGHGSLPKPTESNLLVYIKKGQEGVVPSPGKTHWEGWSLPIPCHIMSEKQK